MSLDTNNDEELEKLRMENELKRMKLDMQFGGDFSKKNNKSNLDPEKDGQFLDYVARYEEQYHNVKQKTVFEFLGNPEYRKSQDIPDIEIKAELKKITELLGKKAIIVDTICKVDDRTLYKFITEELFIHDIDDMQIPGMNTHYIFEEFHPNHEYDIKKHAIDFIKSFLNKKSDYYENYLVKEADIAGLNAFRDSFKSFKLKRFKIESLNFTSELATVDFTISLIGTIDGTNENNLFSGDGKMNLMNQWDYWCVLSVELPKK